MLFQAVNTRWRTWPFTSGHVGTLTLLCRSRCNSAATLTDGAMCSCATTLARWARAGNVMALPCLRPRLALAGSPRRGVAVAAEALPCSRTVPCAVFATVPPRWGARHKRALWPVREQRLHWCSSVVMPRVGHFDALCPTAPHAGQRCGIVALVGVVARFKFGVARHGRQDMHN